MAILNVLRFPDERLRTKAADVAEVNEEIQKIVDDMIETMYDEKGVGLAATQVNIHQALRMAMVSIDNHGAWMNGRLETENANTKLFI